MPHDDENSLGDQNTFNSENRDERDAGPESLGDEMTFAGGPGVGGPQSLGDEATFGGDSGSVDDAFDDDMEVVDLAARYTTEGILGKGGMGEVLLATDTRLERKVAIKRILGSAARSKTAVNRFLTEAKSIAAMNHPNIVQIYDYGRAKDGPFLIMEYVEGSSLLDKCREGAVPLEEAIDLTCQLCDGLSKAHAANIVHRDIKPANVLLTEDGVPKLTDFGLAKDEAADTGMTMAGAVLGTLDFMPPEQRKDAALTDARSDLWSLAATLYQMVTGKSPKIIKFNDVPKTLQDVLGKALEDEKEDRYQSAIDLRDALKESLQSSGADISDIGEGECPQCRTKNDSSRKFCRSCAGSLEAPCLSCSVGMPMWENVCGSCGSKQEGLLQERREAMDANKVHAEELSTDYQYAAATRIAEELGSETDLRLQHLKSWSERFIADCEKERQTELSRAAELLGESLAHEKAHDYPSGVKALEQVPEALHAEEVPGQSETIATVLRRLNGKQSECEQLHKTIRTRVKSRQLNGLLDEVDKLRELIPNREDLKKLQDQLIKRNEKMQQIRDESYREALEAMESQDYQKCLAALSKIDPYVENEEIRDLYNDAELKQHRLKELQEQIREAMSAKRYDGLLDNVLECLSLQQDNTDLQQLREKLVLRSENQNKQNEQVANLRRNADQLRAKCKFKEAVDTLEQIPSSLRDSDIEDALESVRDLSHKRSDAILALQSSQKSALFTDGLKKSDYYASILSIDQSLEDIEFTLLRKKVENDNQQQHQEAERRKTVAANELAAKQRARKLQIKVGSSIAAAFVLILSVMFYLRAQGIARDISEALSRGDYAAALELDPGNRQARMMQQKAEDLASALRIRDYRRALQLDPSNAEALSMKKVADLKQALSDGDYVAALELDPSNAEALSMKKAAEIQQALSDGDYVAALQLDPSNAEALSMKEKAAVIQQALSDGDYVAALQLDPSNAEALSMKKAADIVKAPSLTNSIGMKLRLLPPGVFTMQFTNSRRDKFEVRLTKPFMFGVYEVTQSQYEQVVGNNPSSFKGANNPVDSVSWEDAVEFCRKLSELPAEKAAGRVYRLPTEAEWEYACRAGTTTRFSFDNDAGSLDKYAWYGLNSDSKTHPVGEKQPNPWGLYDMHGNVWEWCSDWYGDYPSGTVTDPSGTVTDPSGANSGPYRVIRGGSFNESSSDRRNWRHPSDSSFHHGFRVSLSPSGQ